MINIYMTRDGVEIQIVDIPERRQKNVSKTEGLLLGASGIERVVVRKSSMGL